MKNLIKSLLEALVRIIKLFDKTHPKISIYVEAIK